MDLSKLKNRPSYPFETIAVALSFSPQCKFILLEAKRIADLLGSTLLLLHIGTKNSEKENELEMLMNNVGINSNRIRVIWMEGEPVDTILKLCKLNIVDLLILGALQKENLIKFYIGSIARNISRKAKCSILLVSKPFVALTELKKIIINGVENPKTIHTINTALYLANYLKVNEVTIVNEMDVPGLTMAIADDSTAPQAKEIKKNIAEAKTENLHALINKCNNKSNIVIKDKFINGKAGYAISKYAKDKQADLLVINSPDTNLTLFDRIFTHDMEYILANLPCNLLIIHSRINSR